LQEPGKWAATIVSQKYGSATISRPLKTSGDK
jgi:hypothetical protein